MAIVRTHQPAASPPMRTRGRPQRRLGVRFNLLSCRPEQEWFDRCQRRKALGFARFEHAPFLLPKQPAPSLSNSPRPLLPATKTRASHRAGSEQKLTSDINLRRAKPLSRDEVSKFHLKSAVEPVLDHFVKKHKVLWLEDNSSRIAMLEPNQLANTEYFAHSDRSGSSLFE